MCPALMAMVLWAQGGEAPARGGGDQGLSMLWMFGLLGLLFWFMVIRPGQKQRKEHEARLAALKKNDRVLFANGLIGTIHAVKEGEPDVIISLDQGRVKVRKASIMQVLAEDDEKEPSKAESSRA